MDRPRGIGAVDQLTGVVLCGGQSRRMGRDKGLLLKDGRPWALVMGDKLQQLGLPVVYSISQPQAETYSAIISPERLIIDSTAGQGPLTGLFSVHHRFPGSDLLLLACDMPDMDQHTMENLIAAWRERDGVGRDGRDGAGHDFFVYEVDGMLQPFCAIYTGAALARALGQDQDGSLQRLLRGGAVQRLPVTDPRAFRNYNAL